jgi:hypothetical protein
VVAGQQTQALTDLVVLVAGVEVLDTTMPLPLLALQTLVAGVVVELELHTLQPLEALELSSFATQAHLLMLQA